MLSNVELRISLFGGVEADANDFLVSFLLSSAGVFFHNPAILLVMFDLVTVELLRDGGVVEDVGFLEAALVVRVESVGFDARCGTLGTLGDLKTLKLRRLYASTTGAVDTLEEFVTVRPCRD